MKQIIRHKNTSLIYKKKYKNALRTSSRRKIQLTHLKIVVEHLKKKQLVSTDAMTVLESTFKGVPSALMKRMLIAARSRSGTTNKEYPKELKSFAMTLQFYSSKAYDYVRQTFNLCLPAPSTMRARILHKK